MRSCYMCTAELDRSRSKVTEPNHWKNGSHSCQTCHVILKSRLRIIFVDAYRCAIHAIYDQSIYIELATK